MISPSKNKQLNCAIYTRKSTEDGLEKEFNSLDAQRESGEAYIKSQSHEGWHCLPDMYDDGGFTGGNMERPALRRLIADIESGKVDCVVVYKVDRLSRSLVDFARMLEVFERKDVAFVSVTQQFNTTNSMGRFRLRTMRKNWNSHWVASGIEAVRFSKCFEVEDALQFPSCENPQLSF